MTKFLKRLLLCVRYVNHGTFCPAPQIEVTPEEEFVCGYCGWTTKKEESNG